MYNNSRNCGAPISPSITARTGIPSGHTAGGLRNSFQPTAKSPIANMASIMTPGPQYVRAHGRAMSSVTNSNNSGSMNSPFKVEHRRNIFYSPRIEEVNFEDMLKSNGLKFKTLGM